MKKTEIISSKNEYIFCRHCGKEIYELDYIYDISEIIGKTGFIHKECLSDFADFNKNSVYKYFLSYGIIEELLKNNLDSFQFKS